MTNSFVSCDWGTSNFRLRLVQGPACEVLGEFRSQDGVASVAAATRARDRAKAFRSTLAKHLSTLGRQLGSMGQECPVVISGMASSSIGWAELPYATLPFRLDGSDVVYRELGPLRTKGGSHRVLLLSGLRGEEEIMRGEE